MNMNAAAAVKFAVVCYLAVINFIGFRLMGADKKRARKQMWRIPEMHLFLTAIIGGSIGSILGMYYFHHKTRHWYFVVGMPLILILQLLLAGWILFYSPFVFTFM